MSSIGAILNNATSGLLAAQTGITTVSNNVANANTPGYVREQVNQSSVVSMGAWVGRRCRRRHPGGQSVP